MSQLKKPTIKNPDLVAALAEFKKQQSVQTEKEMLDAIAAASFIAPITLQNKLNEVEPDENGQRHMEASLMAVSNKDGVKFFPAFTDWLEFLKWKNDPDADTMVITFDQYCGILLKQGVDVSGIVINPAETNIVIRKEKMAEMKGVSLEAEQPQEEAGSGAKQEETVSDVQMQDETVNDAQQDVTTGEEVEEGAAGDIQKLPGMSAESTDAMLNTTSQEDVIGSITLKKDGTEESGSIMLQEDQTSVRYQLNVEEDGQYYITATGDNYWSTYASITEETEDGTQDVEIINSRVELRKAGTYYLELSDYS